VINTTSGERAPILLTGAIALTTPADAELQCQSTGPGNVADASITAIQVATLHQAS
jgi:hypothetical protein